jgi:NADH dehydrogenase FAD-containing subunit
MVAKQLKGKGFHVTLVQAAKTSELSWYICETLTGQKAYEQASTSEPFPSVDKIVYGVATGVCEGKVAVKILNGGIEQLMFDTLVCATGIIMPTFTPTPGQDSAERRKEIEDLANILTDPTKSIVVAGGGAVGVEIAGDILDGGCKDLTLITPGDRLLLDQDEKWSKKALEQLETRGANVLFGERCTSNSETTIAEPGSKVTVTTTSKSLECDVFLAAYTRGPRTAWLAEPVEDSKLPDGILNETGHVEVDEFLASKVYPNLYVIGAASTVDEPALSPNFDSQSQCIVKNMVKAKSAKYGGGMMKKPMIQLVGHQTYGFFVPEAMNVPSCCSTLMCTMCGFPGNLLCPCVWCGILCGPCNLYTCGMCCSDAEGKGVPDTIAGVAKLGIAADMAGYNGLAKVAPTNATMDR